MTQYPAVIELGDLDGQDGHQINGEAAGDRSGGSVASAGDVNGDGFDDVIIGAYRAAPNGERSGASYVVFGRAEEFPPDLDLGALNGHNGFQISGEAAQDYSALSVASAGDVNGDGFDDVIVGAFLADANGRDSGASYVVFGGAAPFAPNLDLSTLDGTNGFQITGESRDDFSGRSVASAGDVNGDGFDDVIVSAPRAGADNSWVGVSYVVFGKAAGFGAELKLSTLDGANGFEIVGEVRNGAAGRAVASAGDVNGDGFDDLIIGADGVGVGGVSYVVFGAAEMAATVELSALDGSNGFKFTGDDAQDFMGGSVASAGDINGDGFADIIVAATGADRNGSRSGTSYVLFGKARGFRAEQSVRGLDGTNGFAINGEAAEDYSGVAVASAGDVNGDGFDDLIIGSSGADPNGTRSGASHVVFGKADAFAAELDLSTIDGTNGYQVNGAAAFDLSGGSVASAGDVDGDGLVDLIIGATGVGAYSGASYVLFGRAPDGPVDRTGTRASQTLVGGDFDDRLNGAGGDDRLLGAGRRDLLEGDDGADTLLGGGDRDRLRGGVGLDELDGGEGADTLSGGRGRDRLSGGEDDGIGDVFVYGRAFHSSAAAAGRDVILHFVSGEDAVDLSRLDIADVAAQASFTSTAGDTIVQFDLDGDGAFDDFGLQFVDATVVVGDFIV